MNERDMYYNSYGFGGYSPLPSFDMGMPYPGNQNQTFATNTYTSSQFNDMNERINRLERQVKRLDQRLIRLETPYANANHSNEPDNNMYMM